MEYTFVHLFVTPQTAQNPLILVSLQTNKKLCLIVFCSLALPTQLNDCVILDPMCGVGAVLLEAAQECSVRTHTQRPHAPHNKN